jgi:hypothetical protein
MMLRGPALLATALLLGASQVACNSILGINQATQEDAGVQASYEVSCSNYCNIIQAACNGSDASKGDNTEYLSSDVCMAICAQMDASSEAISATADPIPDDTLNCRVWHANAALLTDSHFHCPHAGPLGGRLCDDNMDPCTTFCRLDLFFCNGDNQAYTSYQDCLNACEPDAGYSGYVYEQNVTDPEVTDLENFEATNTLNCRMYHLENYLFTGLPVHCSHTSLGGNGVCVGVAPDF